LQSLAFLANWDTGLKSAPVVARFIILLSMLAVF